MKRLRTLLAVTLAALLFPLAAAWVAVGQDDAADEAAEAAAREAKKRAVYEAYAGRDEHWQRMGKPAPDEWLARFPEPGQTVDEFKRRWARKRKTGPARIVIVPFGDFAADRAELLATMREYAQVFFDTPAEVAPARPFPADSWVDARRQHHAGTLLEDLADGVTGDCIARVGFTDQDLFSGRLNFVFGVGSPTGRTGVYSIHRLGATPDVLLPRTLRLMNHEIGHIVGIEHCTFYSCSMNGSNSLAESDRRPIHYCPVDEDKLAWVLGSPTAVRLRALAGFYRAHALEDDAAFLEREAASIDPPGRTPR